MQLEDNLLQHLKIGLCRKSKFFAHQIILNNLDMIYRLFSIFLVINTTFAFAQAPDNSPLAYAKRIGDKLVRETPFRYRLTVRTANPVLNELHSIDFGRSFVTNRAAVAYAFTHIVAPENMELPLEIEHNDGCKVWLNNELVYEKQGDHDLHLVHEERNIELPNHFKVQLKKGNNTLLIKSETRGNTDWRVFIQRPSSKGAILRGGEKEVNLGLATVPDVDKKVAELSNWLIIGVFDNAVKNGQRTGLNTVFSPEKGVQFGMMYKGQERDITWTIPKVDVLGDVIDPLDWGTNYSWNYHNSGVAWAMQQLTELSGDKKYDEFATNYCDFHLQGVPFVNHQVETLGAFNSANHYIINTPLLDFTLATSMPFIHRLRKESRFKDREAYTKYIERMMNYAQKEQVRLPNYNIYTRTSPEKYTTWADDMFMGIPFLVQAAQYAPTAQQRQAFLDDAANQVVNFNKIVWDSTANLYSHAKYSTKNVHLPHWSRANGWGIWATTEVLSILPKTHKHYKTILNHYQIHAGSLAKWQTANGFWLNVLDRKDALEEVSGTAIHTMALARGVTNGWLDAATYKPVVLKGWEALKTQIEADGTVHKICMGTMCSEDVNYYMTRPFYDNDTHGLFAVLFAANAVQMLLNSTK